MGMFPKPKCPNCWESDCVCGRPSGQNIEERLARLEAQVRVEVSTRMNGLPCIEFVEALPCPSCKGKNTTVMFNANVKLDYVSCLSCGTSGPYSVSSIEAIRLWNEAKR